MAGGAEFHVTAQQLLGAVPQVERALRQRQLLERTAGATDVAEGGDGCSRPHMSALDQPHAKAAPREEEGRGAAHQPAAEYDHLHESSFPSAPREPAMDPAVKDGI